MKRLPPPQKPDTDRFIRISNHRTLLRYFQNIEHQFRYANNFGVAISDDDKPVNGDKAVYLRELFVTPQLSPRYLLPEQVLQNELDEHEEAGIELVQAIQPHQRLCILGDPGTGKSTLINWLMLALSYSGENLTKITLGELVPFVLVLRDLNLEKTKNWQDVWQRFLDQEQNQKTLTACFNDDAEVIEQLFASGQALILLDGLDEVTHEGQRQALANALTQAMAEFPRCRFIVTTRVVGFNQAEWFGLEENKKNTKNKVEVYKRLIASAGFDSDQELRRAIDFELTQLLPLIELYLSPFQHGQVQRFVENWYQQYVPNSEHHRRNIDDLLQRLKLNNGLGRLARIPVLLNMICFIHARRGRLPDGRAELYQRIAETYLVSLDKARGLKHKGQDLNFDYHDLCLWLGDIAWTLQKRRTEDDGSILMRESEVKAVLMEGLQVHGYLEEESQTHSNYILDYLSQRSGLFIPRGAILGEEQYAFAHLSFLEYFAACYLEQNAPFFNASEWGKLRRKTKQAWWHETFALFFECQTNPRLTENYLKKLFPKPPADKVNLDAILLADIALDSSVRLPLAVRNNCISKLWELLSLQDSDMFSYGDTEQLAARLWQNPFIPSPPEPEKIKHLNLSNHAISDLAPLTVFHNLQKLSLYDTAVIDLQPLATLHNLLALNLDNTGVSDLQPLAALYNLQRVDLDNTSVSDLQPLTALHNLKILYLNNTAVSDLQPLAGLHSLQELFLDNTAVSDLLPLATLHNLLVLNLDNTGVSDLQPLKALHKLENLSLGNTTVSDLQPLASLTNLGFLDLSDSTISEQQINELKNQLPNLNIFHLSLHGRPTD